MAENLDFPIFVNYVSASELAQLNGLKSEQIVAFNLSFDMVKLPLSRADGSEKYFSDF